MKPTFLLPVFLATSLVVNAQAPVIQNIDPLNAAPNDTVVITGTGFSSTPANLDVWFGPVKGAVISSSEFSMQVEVPAQAALRAVHVVNRSTRLSATSPLKFMPSLRTETFNPAKFSAPVTFSASEELWDLCTCDLNADGKPDIAATKFSTGQSSPFASPTDLMLLQNNSTPGTLTAASFQKFDKSNMPVLNLTFGTDHVVCGDLQGDGYPELVVTRAGSTRNSVHVFRNSTVGTTLNFAPPLQLLLDVGHFATRMVLRDLNRDGKPEIIVTNSFNDFFYVFLNQSSAGTLSFNPTPLKFSIKVTSGDVLTTYEAEVIDLNGDDLPEIVINQFQTPDLYILRNQSTGTVSFSAPQKISLPGGLNRLTSADFNADGKLDLVVTSTLNNQIDILLNQTPADETTFSFAPSISMITSTGPWGVDVSDIEGDGDPDILIANRNQTAMNVFLHNGNFSSPAFTRSDIITTLPTRNLKVGDLDGDGKMDIAYTAFNTSASTTEVGILRSTACHQPDIENPEPVVICNGQTIQLTTAPANNVTFAWTKDGLPVGGNDHYHNITAPGTYRVTVTGEAGACVIASDPLVVSTDAANAPADPTITTNSPLCVGGTLNLQTGTVAGAAYVWTGPNDFTSAAEDPTIPSVTGDHAGTYSLQIQVGQCKSDVVTTIVDVAQLADFAITSNNPTNTVCEGNSVTLSVNNQANHTYQWRRDGSDLAGETGTSLVANQQGSYTVRVTNTTLSCDTETSPVPLTVLTTPVAAFTVASTACTNEELAFTNESQVDARATVMYSWTFGDGFSSSAESPTHSYATSQTFNATLIVSYQGVGGCTDNEMRSIAVVAGVLPSITASALSACPGEEVTLSITGTFASVAWSNTETDNSISAPAGTHTVSTVDGNGCVGEDEVVIEEKAGPELLASAEPSVISVGGRSQLAASGAETYLWTPSETLDDAAIPNPLASPLETTIYRVRGTSADGCTDSLDVTVTVSGAGTFPPAFSPNGDGFYDIWNIRAETQPDCLLNIFDGRGRRIFEGSGQNWDGMYQGKPVPDGTYFYVFGCPDQKPVTGSVLVFK